ncbi:MAG: hypothetical protein LBP53_07995 [Candidatus Peribacteria bacterium]|nr:hypothetical protein [Candidatus Peribacteria bacterium]
MYYNSQRGERLWPLDKITSDDLGFTSDGLLMSGGLFTSCSGAVAGLTGDAYGIYGRLSHTFNTQNYILLAGMQYSTKTNTVKPTSSLASTFQRFDNKYPVGLVYDYN